jgi:hypothetical protein
MSTAGITSPRAAELYFNNSLIGHLSSLLAQARAGSRNRRGPSPRGRVGRKPLASVTRAAAAPRNLLARLDAWFWRQEQKRRETYFAGATDIFELERRMQAYDRAIPRYY